VAVTPSLEEGTILKGVTRDSVLSLLKKRGYKVEERKISIDELVAAYKAGQVQEVFGTGTAATIAPIKELKYKDNIMQFDTTTWTIAPAIKQDMDDIKSCAVADEFGWMYQI
jgi:branched-chain amino acid aminotransferase